MNDLQISNWVNITLKLDSNNTFYVHNICIIESTSKMENTIYSFDVGQKGVSETLTFSCTFYQPGNINYSQISRDNAFWFMETHQPVKSCIRDSNSRFSRIYGTERKVLNQIYSTSDGIELFVIELKNEDLPTFGKPTIPIFKLFPGLPNNGFSTT